MLPGQNYRNEGLTIFASIAPDANIFYGARKDAEMISISITFGESQVLKRLDKLDKLELFMSQFVKEFRASLASVKAEIAELNTVGESIKALVAAQTAAINDLAQKAIDAPTAEEKNELLVGIQEVAASVNDEVDELQGLVQQNTPSEGVA